MHTHYIDPASAWVIHMRHTLARRARWRARRKAARIWLQFVLVVGAACYGLAQLAIVMIGK